MHNDPEEFGLYDDGDDTREDELEEARQEAYAAGALANEGSGFWYGVLIGILATLVLIYFGWCHPYTR